MMLTDETTTKIQLLKYIYEDDRYIDMIIWLELQRIAEHENNYILTLSHIIDTNSSMSDITEILNYIKETLKKDKYLLLSDEDFDKRTTSKNIRDRLAESLIYDNYRIIFSIFYNKERCFGINYDKTYYKKKYKSIFKLMKNNNWYNLLQIMEIVIEYNDFKMNFYWFDKLLHNINRQIKEQIYHFLYRCI